MLNSMKKGRTGDWKPSKPEEPQLTAVRVDEGLGRGSRVDQSARNGSHRRTAQMATRQGAVDDDADPDPQTVAVCCRRTATGRSRRTTKDSSVAQHCWERQPGAALLGTAPWRSRHGGQQWTAAARKGRSATADGQQPGSARMAAELDEIRDGGWAAAWIWTRAAQTSSQSSERAAAGSGQRRRGSGRGRRTGGGRIWAAAAQTSSQRRDPANGRWPDQGGSGRDPRR
jgi:hypothetical protein